MGLLDSLNGFGVSGLISPRPEIRCFHLIPEGAGVAHMLNSKPLSFGSIGLRALGLGLWV